MGSATPGWDLWLDSIWGPSYEGDSSVIPSAAICASNFVFGTNPPYTIQDFLSFYPKFGGTTISPAPTGTATQGSAQLTGVSSTIGIAVGNSILDSSAFFPDGTVISSIGSGTLTLSNEAVGTGPTTLTIWNAPIIPFLAIFAYIALASASLVQARWLEQWTIAMGLFVAHFLTLYAQSDGNPSSTASQIAAQGLSNGVQVAKSVGDVSVNYQPVQGIEGWAAWNLTSYGQLLATMGRLVGSGPVLLW